MYVLFCELRDNGYQLRLVTTYLSHKSSYCILKLSIIRQLECGILQARGMYLSKKRNVFTFQSQWYVMILIHQAARRGGDFNLIPYHEGFVSCGNGHTHTHRSKICFIFIAKNEGINALRGRRSCDRMIVGFTTTYDQCLSPLTLWVRMPLVGKCTWYNFMWESSPVTCGRSTVFSRYYGFLHQ